MHNINPNYNTIPIKYTEFIKFPENKENKDIIFNNKYLSSVLSVHQYAFANNDTLSNIYIPTNVISIGENAFHDSTNAELYIEHYKSESDLYEQSFTWGMDYDKIHFLSADYQTFSTNGLTFLYTYDNSIKGNIIYGVLEKDISSLEIPSCINGIPVLEIGANAFKGMSELTSVNIPETVSVLNEYCFHGCFSPSEDEDNYLSIIIPSSVCEIKFGALADCTGLSGIYFMSKYNNDNEISTFNDQTNGCGYHNYFTGNFNVTLKKVKCNLSSIDDTAFNASRISKIEYVWKDDSENLCYQHSENASNDVEDGNNGIIFCNDNFAIIYDNTSSSDYKSWNYYSGICNCNFIFELRANSYSNENDFRSCFYPEKKFDVRLLYGAMNSATNLTNPLYKIPRENGGEQHKCPIIPCYIALFFGKFIGFGKLALRNFCKNIGGTKNNGVRMALFFLDDSTIEPSLGSNNYDENYYSPLSESIQVKSDVFNEITQLDGSFIYEANIGSLLLAFNCLILIGYNFDSYGATGVTETYTYYINGNLQKITWAEMWNSKQLGKFRQFSFRRADGDLDRETFDNCFGISKIGSGNSKNEELISIGPSFFRWYNIGNLNSTLSVKNLTDISSFENNVINSKNLSAFGSYAFNGNNGITAVTFEKTGDNNFDHIVEFKDFSFRSCNALTKIEGLDLLTNLSSIGEGCFYWIASLISVDLGNSIISTLYDNTFRDDTSLTTLCLPSTLSDIRSGNVFYNTPKLSTIYFGHADDITSLPNHNDFYAVDTLTAILEDSTDTNTNFLFKYDNIASSSEDNKKIAQIVTQFGGTVNNTSNVDLNLTKLKDDTISENKLSILQYAFHNSANISSVTTDDRIIIENNAFDGSVGLKTISIGDGTRLGSHCFSNITTLTDIVIGRNIEYSDDKYDGMFRNLMDSFSLASFSNVVNVDLSNNNTIGFIPKYLCKGNTHLVSFEFPRLATYIGESAFNGCTGLLGTIDISNLSNLLAIDNDAFGGCSNISEIVLPENLIHIGSHAFTGCVGITSITIPNKVTTIGNGAFEASGIKTIIIDQNISDSPLSDAEFLIYDWFGDTDISDVSIVWK